MDKTLEIMCRECHKIKDIKKFYRMNLVNFTGICFKCKKQHKNAHGK